MKPLDLMELMTELPDEYIESAAEPIAAHRAFRLRYVLPAIAACLAIAVLAAIYPKLRVEQPGRVDFPLSGNNASAAATDTTTSSGSPEAKTAATTVSSNGGTGMATEITDGGGSSTATFTTTANTTENAVSAAVTTTDAAVVTPPTTTVSRPVESITTTAPPLTIPTPETPETPTTSTDDRPSTAYLETVQLTVTRRPLSAMEPAGGNSGDTKPPATPSEAELLFRGGRYYLAITLPYACRYANVTDASLERDSGELSVIVMHSEYDASCEPFRIEIELPQTIFQEIGNIDVTQLLRSNFDPKDELTLAIY